MKHKSVAHIGLSILVLIAFITSASVTKLKPISFFEVYKEVKIGNQVWMAQNLNVATFRNGDTITQAKTKEAWRKANAKKQPAWCYYNNDSLNGAVYGKLYNWAAVSDQRGLAPTGWHIPADSEWRILYNFLGGKKEKTATKIKSSSGWEEGGNGNNTSNFNALPAGVRDQSLINKNNGYRWMGSLTIFWSTNKPKSWADISCFAIRGSDKAGIEWHDPWGGYSVRCVQD
jgi:uncharacterized protein (TIGR02145 family)